MCVIIFQNRTSSASCLSGFVCGRAWFNFLPKSFCRTCPSYRSSARSFTMILSPTKTSFIQSISTYMGRIKWLQPTWWFSFHSMSRKKLKKKKKKHFGIVGLDLGVSCSFRPVSWKCSWVRSNHMSTRLQTSYQFKQIFGTDNVLLITVSVNRLKFVNIRNLMKEILSCVHIIPWYWAGKQQTKLPLLPILQLYWLHHTGCVQCPQGLPAAVTLLSATTPDRLAR